MIQKTEALILVCCECGEEFVLTTDGREFLQRCGREEIPRRCRSCFVQMKRRKRAARSRTTAPAQGDG